MLFNSWEFAVFLPIVVGLYFGLPHRTRWAWLLVSSCVFYMFFIPEYILILFLTIAVDYVGGIMIERSTGSAKKVWLWTSLVVTCAILFVFKYFNFAREAILTLGSALGYPEIWPPNASMSLLLPIGLSFHTFQSLSYVIEVYRGHQKAERHFGIYSVYVLFFPQLVAGPIERPQNLLHQFREKHVFDPIGAASGLRLIVWGLFMKTVVADRLGVIVDFVYDKPDAAPAFAKALATIFFAFEIFADFQGYSNVARGVARLMGFELMKNFDNPYGSKSVTEFWRRWHISLSTWFRDYVFVPLGGSHGSGVRTAVNLLITFGISGLWHGANWTYVIWGALNGAYVILEKLMGLPKIFARNATTRAVGLAWTFSLILTTWVFFRASSVNQGLQILSALPEGMIDFFDIFVSGQLFDDSILKALGTSGVDLLCAIFGILAMQMIESLKLRIDFEKRDWGSFPWTRWVGYALVVGVVIVSWIYFPASNKPFIYFQF